MLGALSVAGRPFTEVLLGAVTGLDVEAMRRGLRELASERMLAEDAPAVRTGPGMRCWPRRWPARCCLANDPDCMSAQPARWRR